MLLLLLSLWSVSAWTTHNGPHPQKGREEISLKAIDPTARYTQPRSELQVLASPLTDPDSVHAILSSSAPWVCDAAGAVTTNLHEQTAEQLRKAENSELKQKYATLFEGVAARDLSAAMGSGRGDLLATVAYKYRFTPSGTKAATVAARLFLDKGDPVTAALLLKGWLRDQEADLCKVATIRSTAFASLTTFSEAGFQNEFDGLKNRMAACENLTDKEKSQLEKVPRRTSQYELFQLSWREHLSDGIRPDRPVPPYLKLALVYGAEKSELLNLFIDRVPFTSLCENLDPLPELPAQLEFIKKERGLKFYPLRIKAMLPGFKERIRQQSFPDSEVFLLSLLGEQAVPLLVEGLSHEAESVRYRSARALAFMGPSAEAAIPALIKALPTSREATRLEVVRAFTQIGEKSHAAIPALIQIYASKDVRVNYYVLSALAQYGEQSLPALPLLVDALAFGDPERRNFAKKGLLNIGEKAIPQLIEYISEKNNRYWEKIAVAGLIGDFGEKAEAAVPDLIKCLSSETPDLRRGAVRSLGNLGKAGFPAVEALKKIREGNDLELNRAAELALYHIQKAKLGEGH